MKTKSAQHDAWQYVACTYGLFVVLMVTLGWVATRLLHGTPLVMRWLTAIVAWTPTYVLFFMFKRICPDATLRGFIRTAFGERLNRRQVVTTAATQVTVFVLSVAMVSILNGVTVASLLDLSSPTVMSAVFFTLIQGATGEELGWRGYLSPVAWERFGVIKGSLMVSLIWSFWHAPIWFLGSGYSGTALLRYIIVFVICITSVGFVMGLRYHSCRNLLVPVCMHFTFNFLGEMYKGPMIDLVSWYAVFYTVLAASYFVLERARLEPASKTSMVPQGGGFR